MRSQIETSILDLDCGVQSSATGQGYDLEALDAKNLASLYDAVGTITQVVSGLSCQPCFTEDDNPTKAGDVLVQLCEHLDALGDDIEKRLKITKASDQDQKDARAHALIQMSVKYNESVANIAALAARLSARFLQ